MSLIHWSIFSIPFLAKRVPFEVTFQSDGFETSGGAVADGIEVVTTGSSQGTKGFQLYYIQS